MRPCAARAHMCLQGWKLLQYLGPQATFRDPEKVYFFAFADDLALLSCNIFRVKKVLEQLNQKLHNFGMQLNPKKTCWLPFLPVGTKYQVQVPGIFRMKLAGEKLKCVDEFCYLGYHENVLFFFGYEETCAEEERTYVQCGKGHGETLTHLRDHKFKITLLILD